MKLQELEQKYEELGKAIKKLKNEKKGKRWRPKHGDEYWRVNGVGHVDWAMWVDRPDDLFAYNQNNCFQTKEEAEEHLENLKTKGELRQLAEELNDGEAIDWSNLEQRKYCFYFDHSDKTINCDYDNAFKMQGAIYCLDPDFRSKAIDCIGKERLVKMIKSGV